MSILKLKFSKSIVLQIVSIPDESKKKLLDISQSASAAPSPGGASKDKKGQYGLKSAPLNFQGGFKARLGHF